MSEVHRNPVLSRSLDARSNADGVSLNSILYISDIRHDLVCQKLYTCEKKKREKKEEKKFFYILLSQGLSNCFDPILINLDFPQGVGTWIYHIFGVRFSNLCQHFEQQNLRLGDCWWATDKWHANVKKIKSDHAFSVKHYTDKIET